MSNCNVLGRAFNNSANEVGYQNDPILTRSVLEISLIEIDN